MSARRHDPLVPLARELARVALRRHIDGALDHRSPLCDELLPQLLALSHREGAVVAVIHYGSLLTDSGAADSEPDFYLVVDPLRAFHRGLASALLNQVLPPSIYHPRLLAGGRDCRAKVCVIGAEQLRRATSAGAADLYHLGRFSKRIGLVWARDPGGRALALEACATSLEILTGLALTRVAARFTLEQVLLELLGLSYLAERRIAEPAKARLLLDADRLHLERATRLALAAQLHVTPLHVHDDDGSAYQQRPSEARAAHLDAWLRRSRRRALARWPKHLVTFDGWLDYVLAKLRRASGIHLELTPRQRRHPLLLGWPRLVTLVQRGLVR